MSANKTSKKQNFNGATEILDSTKIDEMLLHFDLHVRERLIPAIARGDASEEAISAAIQGCLFEDEYKAFQWKTLGVYGGAFGLSHNSRKNFVLFQTNKVETDDIKGVRLPYLPEQLEESQETTPDYEDLIDALFLGRRGKQPLMGRGLNSYSPEFYWQLAQIYHDDYLRFEPSAFTQYLRANRSSYVYCSIGEVVYFLYAWRLLLRHVQRAGTLTKPLSENLSLTKNEPIKAVDIWAREIWREQEGFRPELEWLTTLEELKDSEKNREFSNAVHAQWETWHKELDLISEQSSGISDAWRKDWFSLGLLHRRDQTQMTGARPTSTLLALLGFARGVDKQQRSEFERLEKFVAGLIEDNSTVAWKELEALDGMIQANVAAFLLKRMNGNRCISELLSGLHGQARFPLLPYFYWTAIDGLPKEHFVFPIWESWRFPVEVRVPEGDGGSTTFTVPAVGIALIAIRPMLDMSSRVLRAFDPSDVKQVGFREAHERLFRTERVFVRIARPVIDAAFYGVLIRDSAHSEGRAEQIESWAHALQTKLALLQQLYDKLSAESTGETMIVNMDSWRNIGGSLRSLRRTIVALAYYRRIKDYLERRKKTLVNLTEDDEVSFRQVENRCLGNVLLDAFHLMQAKVRLREEKYGDLADRMRSFTEVCNNSLLPPLQKGNGQENSVSFEKMSQFFPSDKSVEFTVHLPSGTSLNNYEVWKRISLNRHKDPLVFYYDAVLGVVIDEILSNALKHVDEVNGKCKITIDLAVENLHNMARSGLTWAALRVTNTAAYTKLQGELPASRSLLDRPDSGLGLFFNRELSRTLTGDLNNYDVKVDADFQAVISVFRFPVLYRRTLSKPV